MTFLYFIRHAEAVSNVTPIFGGINHDQGLTLRGINQAEHLRDRLLTSRDLIPDVFISSTLPRARQTADIISPAFNLPIILDDDIQELRPGLADGMTNEQVRAEFGMIEFYLEPFRPIAPDGESWASFNTRVARAVDRISRDHEGKKVVIVCHGGVIDAAFLYMIGIGAFKVPSIGFFTHNTSITEWEFVSKGARSQWRLRRYNDIGHLSGIEYVASPSWHAVEDFGDAEASVPLPTEHSLSSD